MKFLRSIILTTLLALALPVLTACVSTNVNEKDFAEPLPEHIDPDARAKAVAEMRQKAAGTGRTPPSAFVNDNPELEPKSAAEVTELKNELSADSQTQTDRITDEELASKKKELEALRREAQSHYENTVKSIEN